MHPSTQRRFDGGGWSSLAQKPPKFHPSFIHLQSLVFCPYYHLHAQMVVLLCWRAVLEGEGDWVEEPSSAACGGSLAVFLVVHPGLVLAAAVSPLLLLLPMVAMTVLQ